MRWRETTTRPVLRGARRTFPSPTARASSWRRFVSTCPWLRRPSDRVNCSPNVRIGSKADIPQCNRHVRGAIECDPGHDFRMDEVLRLAANFPNAFVRLPPGSRQICQDDRAQGPATFRDRQFRQPALSAHSVHDLNLLRTAGYGPEDPIAPGARFVIVAQMHEGLEREGRVAQPAVTVVPVPDAAQVLGQ